MTASEDRVLDADRRRRNHRRLVATAAIVLIVDIAAKVAASAWLDHNGIDLPGPLDLRLAYNPGVAFSLGSTAPLGLVLAITTAIAVVIAVAAWRGMFPSAVAAGAVVGGALANVIDRSEAGTVVDMLYTGWWPTFNLADVAVVCGGIALALTAFRAAPDTDEPAPDETGAEQPARER